MIALSSLILTTCYGFVPSTALTNRLTSLRPHMNLPFSKPKVSAAVSTKSIHSVLARFSTHQGPEGPRDEDDDNDGWRVPSNFHIPIHEIDFSFARSSGAGGQNVNKVETQAILKLHLERATWIPSEVRNRIRKNEQNRINKEGYLVLSSQEHRTQLMNRNQVLDKLEQIILKHYARPKERTVRKTGVFSAKEKQKKKIEKQRQSSTKENRRKVDF